MGGTGLPYCQRPAGSRRLGLELNHSQQRAVDRPRARGTDRSLARRAELIAIGRKLLADTSYDALSMDDIARQAHVAKGLIYYYFKSKRGYYLAIVEDSVADLISRAASGLELPRSSGCAAVDGYLRYAGARTRPRTARSSPAESASTPTCRASARACARSSSRPSPKGHTADAR